MVQVVGVLDLLRLAALLAFDRGRAPALLGKRHLASRMDRLAGFTGLLECTPEDGGTRVRRRLEFRFPRPLSWLLDPPLTRWLAKDVPAELARLKAHLEQPA